MKNHLAKKDDALTDSSFFTLHVLFQKKNAALICHEL